MPPRRSKGDDDLAEVGAGFKVAEGFGGVLEGEDRVDDRAEAGSGVEVDDIGEHGAGTDVDAVEADAFAQDLHGLDFAGGSGEDADEGDVAAEASGLERAVEGIRAADFDDVIDTETAGLFEHPGSPVRSLAVVEGGVRAEFTEAGGLGIGTGDGEDTGAESFGDLECEDGDAAAALDEDGGTGKEGAADSKGVPGGDGRAGESGGLGKVEGIREADEGIGLDNDLLPKNPVHRAAKGGGGVALAEGAIQPGRHEGDDNAVTGLPGGDTGTDGQDLSGAIRAGDPGNGSGDAPNAEDVHVVAEIEGHRADSDKNLAGAGGEGRRIGELKRIEAQGAGDVEGFHRAGDAMGAGGWQACSEDSCRGVREVVKNSRRFGRKGA